MGNEGVWRERERGKNRKLENIFVTISMIQADISFKAIAHHVWCLNRAEAEK